MKVGIVGMGHVGLVTGIALASAGHEVAATDSDKERVSMVADGRPPFFEPDLEPMLHKQLEAGSLCVVDDVSEAVRGAQVVLICVGTPPRAGGDANLWALESSARDVARAATGELVLADKSTVPAGTADRLKTIIRQEAPHLDMPVVSNPEFLREGRAMEDALHPARILVGAESPVAFQTMRELYEPFVREGSRLIETDLKTAELGKHASNAFLAMKVSYINAVARVCERTGADVVAIADIMGSDPRIGRAHLGAGMGFGGSCFHKDLQAFDRLAKKVHYDFPLLQEVQRLNSEALTAVLDKIEDAVWNLEGKRIALLGLAFKPGTDDVRFSPPLALAQLLLERGARVTGCDPLAAASAKSETADLEVSDDPYVAASDAHCVVLCTDWEEYRNLDLARLHSIMARPVIIDGRNALDAAALAEAGFAYYPTGRPQP